MPDPSDPLAAELAAIRELVDAPRERIRELKALAAWTRRLLAAAADVLKLHAGDVNEDYPHETPLCGECGEWVPCTTTKTITRVLTGEDPQ